MSKLLFNILIYSCWSLGSLISYLLQVLIFFFVTHAYQFILLKQFYMVKAFSRYSMSLDQKDLN